MSENEGKITVTIKASIPKEILLNVLELKEKEKASCRRKGKKRLERVGKGDLVSYPQRGVDKVEGKAKRKKERKREELLKQREEISKSIKGGKSVNQKERRKKIL